jgi:hypothetical protein
MAGIRRAKKERKKVGVVTSRASTKWQDGWAREKIRVTMPPNMYPNRYHR